MRPRLTSLDKTDKTDFRRKSAPAVMDAALERVDATPPTGQRDLPPVVEPRRLHAVKPAPTRAHRYSDPTPDPPALRRNVDDSVRRAALRRATQPKYNQTGYGQRLQNASNVYKMP